MDRESRARADLHREGLTAGRQVGRWGVLVALFALAASAGAQRYTPGRTPWGDPDLQGDYTNSNEYATPLERPERFAGKRLQVFANEFLQRYRGND